MLRFGTGPEPERYKPDLTLTTFYLPISLMLALPDAVAVFVIGLFRGAKIIIYDGMEPKNLRQAVSGFNISSTTIMTDDGTENTLLKSETTHIIAQKDVAFSNSMVEAVNKHLKYQYIFPKGEIESLEKLTTVLQNSIDDYNTKPHGALF